MVGGLLVKVGCLFQEKTYVSTIKKQLVSTSVYKEVNRTEPSPSVKVSWYGWCLLVNRGQCVAGMQCTAVVHGTLQHEDIRLR
jgi:hypothetical protein